MAEKTLKEISAKELIESFAQLKKDDPHGERHEELRKQMEARMEPPQDVLPYERALRDLSMGRYRGFEPKMTYEAMSKGIANEPVEPLIDAVRDLYRQRQARGKAMDGRRKRIAKSYNAFVKAIRKTHKPSEVETRLRYEPLDDRFEVTATYTIPPGAHPMNIDGDLYDAFDASGLADAFEWIDSGTMLKRQGEGFAATQRDITWAEIDTYDLD